MLHIENYDVKKRILEGNFGLEKESLRIKSDGTLSHSPHPFTDDTHIVKDFCENQTEINTSVHTSAKEAIEELEFHNRRIYERLEDLPEREYLWPFSNPPYIENESDIPVAIFGGIEVSKTAYREYLSAKYGRYKMIFSGIHVNYSFSEKLLEADFQYQKETDYQEYKKQILSGTCAENGCIWLAACSSNCGKPSSGQFVRRERHLQSGCVYGNGIRQMWRNGILERVCAYSGLS